MSNIKYMILLFAGLFLFACDDEMPEEPKPEEIITTLTYTLTGDSETVVLSFVDLDGDGGSDPVITGGTFKAGVDYSGSMILLNASIDPVEDVTEEILEEADEHQFFFTNNLGIDIDYTDSDTGGLPLGLTTELTNLTPGTGSLTVILRHEPDKSGEGVEAGDITNAGGETDIEVTFPITIE